VFSVILNTQQADCDAYHKISRLMVLTRIIATCYENSIGYRSTVCEKTVQFVKVKTASMAL